MTLSSEDINQIRTVVQEGLEDQEQKFEKKLTEVKSEFFEKIDLILKEVTTAREERPLLEDRIEALEKINSENPHIITS